MSLTAISSLESARRKFFMNTKYIMPESRNQTFLGYEAELSLTAISSLESTRRTFFMNSKYIMSGR